MTALAFDRALLERAFEVRLPRGAPSRFANVTPAPGKVEPGGVYVALPPELPSSWPHRDRQEDIDRAIDRGAAAIVLGASEAIIRRGVARVPAPDTYAGLRRLAGAWRARFAKPVVAVAGSVGKTTTTAILASLLGAAGRRVCSTQHNQNGAVGLPMTLLALRDEHDVAVLEIGIDAPGQMATLVALTRPTHAIVTAIAEEHLVELGDLETVAREECVVLDDVIARGGTIALPAHDEWLARWHESHPDRGVLRYALGRSRAEVELRGRLDLAARRLRVTRPGRSAMTLPLRLHGAHNASNLMGAIALATALGVSDEHIASGAAALAPVAGRSVVTTVPPGVTVIGDHYNASPRSMRAGLELLARCPGRRWACLGDMLELGREERRFHRELATPIVAHAIDRVELVGARMRALVDELRRRGFDGVVRCHASSDALARALRRDLQVGDAVLLKASNSMRFDQVWEALQPP